MATDLKTVLAYEAGRDEADAEWSAALSEAMVRVGSSAVLSGSLALLWARATAALNNDERAAPAQPAPERPCSCPFIACKAHPDGPCHCRDCVQAKRGRA